MGRIINMDIKITASTPLKIDTTYNTRDLGGYKTKDGKTTKMRAFLRSDLPAQITDYSKKVLLDYGVRCVVDLRSLVEVNSMPNALSSISEIDYYLLPMLDQTTSQGFSGKMPDNMGTVYIDLLNHSQKDFGKMFHIFAQHSDSTNLFNCTAGKDRTGVTAMLLLNLAGVDTETILVDYEVTENNMHTVFEKQKVMIKEKYGIDVPDCAFSSERFQMKMAIDYLEKKWGDAEKYLLDAAVSEEDIRIVRSMLVD